MASDYDVIVIGGGIQGVGVAQATAAAGYRTLVIEKTALAAGTSSKSSKLIHGGLRYLETLQFQLVRTSLQEKNRLLQLAPELIEPLPFYIPVYNTTQRKAWQIRIGLMLYQVLGGFKQHTQFKSYSAKRDLPLTGLRKQGLKKIFLYSDAQTDDTALTQAVMRSAETLGAELVCPAMVQAISKKNGCFNVVITQQEQSRTITAKVVINAAGPWVNYVLDNVDIEDVKKMPCDLVQGAHIVLDVPAPEGAVYVEAPQDKRAVFIMPYKNSNLQNKTLVGTTEKLFIGNPDEVIASEQEIAYLKYVYQYYFPDVDAKVIKCFAGLRVLPKTESSLFNRPRDTIIDESSSGLFTLYGGKLTGYRAMAELVLEKIEKYLPKRDTGKTTRDIKL